MNIVNINNIIFKETLYPSYFVSKDGKVAIITFENNFIKKFFLLRQQKCKNGYKRVEIQNKNGNEKGHALVHRLVFSAWGNEPLDPLKVIDHIDANPSNNTIENLRQVSQQQNITASVTQGNFGKGHWKKIAVKDLFTNTVTIYDSVTEFLKAIDAPTYMRKNNSLACLQKRSEYKHRYITWTVYD